MLVVTVILAFQKPNTVDRVHPNHSHAHSPQGPLYVLLGALASAAESERSVLDSTTVSGQGHARGEQFGRRNLLAKRSRRENEAVSEVQTDILTSEHHKKDDELILSCAWCVAGGAERSGPPSAATDEETRDTAGGVILGSHSSKSDDIRSRAGHGSPDCRACSKLRLRSSLDALMLKSNANRWQEHPGSQWLAPGQPDGDKLSEKAMYAVRWAQRYVWQAALRVSQALGTPATGLYMTNIDADGEAHQAVGDLRAAHSGAAAMWRVFMRRVSVGFVAVCTVLACATLCTISSLLLCTCVAGTSICSEDIARRFITAALKLCGQVCARLTAASVWSLPAPLTELIEPRLDHPLLVGPLIYFSFTLATWMVYMVSVLALYQWGDCVPNGAAYAWGVVCCVLFAVYCSALLMLFCFSCAAVVTLGAMVALLLGFHASDETGDNALEATSGEVDRVSLGASGSMLSQGSQSRLE